MMKPKIYYITRTYTHNSQSGGALMREGAVKQFVENGYEIEVISCGNDSNVACFRNGEKLKLLDNGKHSNWFNWNKQRFGIAEDYLDDWVTNCLNYLVHTVTRNDVVFTTTGGDLASLKVGSLVKEKLDCIYIANFRDPVLHTSVNHKRLTPYTHVNRDRLLKKYIKNSDLVITSSASYKQNISEVYSGKVINNYFGYLNNSDDISLYEGDTFSESLNLVYAGTLNKYQGPKLYNDIFDGLENTKLTIYTNCSSISSKSENILIKEAIPRERLYEEISKNYNAGFVSLGHDYFSVCIPSKIYEYINLGLPIFGVLPDGDAKNIINDNGYGYVESPDNIEKLHQRLDYYSNNLSCLLSFREKIIADRESWSMEVLFRDVLNEIDDLVNKKSYIEYR